MLWRVHARISLFLFRPESHFYDEIFNYVHHDTHTSSYVRTRAARSLTRTYMRARVRTYTDVNAS